MIRIRSKPYTTATTTHVYTTTPTTITYLCLARLAILTMLAVIAQPMFHTSSNAYMVAATDTLQPSTDNVQSFTSTLITNANHLDQLAPTTTISDINMDSHLQDNTHAIALLSSESSTPATSNTEHTVCEVDTELGSENPLFWIYMLVCLFLILFGGLMSGLTVGFMSIDRLKLEVMKEAGTEEEKIKVEKVKPVLDNHHLLLVTLLLCNAIAMEALPIFLDRLVPAYAAIILSVTFVLFFGEVIPQAICTANPLDICARTAWIVRLLQVCFYPVVLPLAKLLDHILGDHSAHVLFKRSELNTLINLHGEQKTGGVLERDEVTVIRGALEFSHKTAKDVMSPIEYVCMLEINRILDMDTLAEILGMGHSRIPVFSKSRHNVKGLLLVKRLIVCNPDDNRPVRHFVHRRPLIVPPTLGLYELLNKFQTGRSHLALVSEHTREYEWALQTGEDVAGYCRILGVVTLEDVVEELIKEEIEDEVDVGFSAASRPAEQEAERQEHRKAGVERAKNKIRQLIAAIRQRRASRFPRRLLDPESVDPSHLQMTEHGEVTFTAEAEAAAEEENDKDHAIDIPDRPPIYQKLRSINSANGVHGSSNHNGGNDFNAQGDGADVAVQGRRTRRMNVGPSLSRLYGRNTAAALVKKGFASPPAIVRGNQPSFHDYRIYNQPQHFVDVARQAFRKILHPGLSHHSASHHHSSTQQLSYEHVYGTPAPSTAPSAHPSPALTPHLQRRSSGSMTPNRASASASPALRANDSHHVTFSFEPLDSSS